MSVYKEGTLSKWTNYYLGWQPRWFILDNGILSYYLSSQEVNQGSRGSVKVVSCNIKAHTKDQKRIDITIKGERYMYLRTTTPSERQKWLIALGQAKQEEPTGDSSQLEATAIKSKIMILHTNCQLLVSHIAALKSAVNDKTKLNETSLDELSSKISISCDEFLNVLAECMDLNYDEGGWPANLKPLTNVSAASPLISLSPHRHIAPSPSNGFFFSNDNPRVSTPTLSRPRPLSPLSLPAHLQRPESRQSSVSNEDTTLSIESVPNYAIESDSQDSIHPSQRTPNSEQFLTPISSPANTPPPSSKPSPPTSPRSLPDVRHCETFFSKLPHKSVRQEFTDVTITPDGGIPTERFLNCCQAAVPFFDALSPTAFSPVKQDINGNIDKLFSKYKTDPVNFHTLQAMVSKELEEGSHNAKNSATDALVWLKRAMEFIQVFLLEVANGEKRLDIAAGSAYSQSLRRHHNWIVKGIFNLAVKAVPYHNDFLKLLGSDGSTLGEEIVMQDMKGFSLALNGMIVILNRFYISCKLDT